MNPLEITYVKDRAQLSRFIDLPWKIYADYDQWVPPLKSEVRALLDTKKHPFWKFSEQILILATRNGEPVGRIAGIINRNHNEYHNERCLFWGFFECTDDQRVADTLFEHVNHWGKSKGMVFSRGPISPSTNYEIGLLIDGFDQAPSIMMPYNPPYYSELITGAGFEKEKDLYAFVRPDKSSMAERIQRLSKRFLKRNAVRVRPTTKKSFQNDCLIAKEIYDDAWADNWCFSPMTQEEITHSAKTLLSIADPELFCFIEVNSEPAAVLICPLDVNPVLKKLNGKIGVKGLYHLLRAKKEIRGLRLMLFGVKKAYWKTGVPLVAFDYCLKFLENKHYDYIEMGWTLEDNHSVNQLARETGGRRLKTYRIYRMDF